MVESKERGKGRRETEVGRRIRKEEEGGGERIEGGGVNEYS